MSILIPLYRAPRLELAPKRQIEIPFQGVVAAAAYLTLFTTRLPYRYRITQVKMTFDEEAYNLIEHRWYTSSNQNAPTTSWPGDSNIFGREGPTIGFVGRAEIKVVNCLVEAPEGEDVIKLCVFNGTPYAHRFSATCVIEEV